jgi:hypothetical protein
MHCRTGLLALLIWLVCLDQARPSEEQSGLDQEGFITTWLLLAPIPLAQGQTGEQALGKQQIPREARLRPQHGDKVKVAGKELVWRKYRAKEYFFDFNDFLGKQTEDSVGYAICHIHAQQEMNGIFLLIGSDDQALVYLNGKEVLRQVEDRPLEKDEDTTEVSLRRGVNVLVFKVINEKEDWSGCARFMDKKGRIIRSLKVTAGPK